jgi:hypothetical protein
MSWRKTCKASGMRCRSLKRSFKPRNRPVECPLCPGMCRGSPPSCSRITYGYPAFPVPSRLRGFPSLILIISLEMTSL